MYFSIAIVNIVKLHVMKSKGRFACQETKFNKYQICNLKAYEKADFASVLSKIKLFKFENLIYLM